MAIKSSSQVSLTDLTDAYSVILTSESFTFVGNTSGAPSGLSCTTQVVAFCGSTPCTKVTIGTVTCPTGISATISNNGSTSPTITFKTTATVSTACEATIPVTVDDVTINKKFSFAVAKTGATGSTGKGVSAIKTQYYLSTSKTSQTGGSWTDTCPALTKGTYIWTRDYITWSNNTTSTTTPVLDNALNGLSEDVSNKVTKGTVSSEISQEDGIITITGDRLIIESTNFNLDENGKVECSDISITGGIINVTSTDSTAKIIVKNIQGAQEITTNLYGNIINMTSGLGGTLRLYACDANEVVTTDMITGYFKQELFNITPRYITFTRSTSDVGGLKAGFDGIWSGSPIVVKYGIDSLDEPVKIGANDSGGYIECDGTITASGTITGGSVKTAAGVDLDAVNTALSGKAASNHNHDSRYYTETEVNNLLAQKAASSHTHAAANINNLGTRYYQFTTKTVASGKWTNVLSVTIPPGTYFATAHTSISNTPGYRMLLYFGTNSGASNMGTERMSDDNGNRAVCNVHGALVVTANTTLYVRCYHTAGSNQTVYCGYDIVRIK